MPWIQFPTCGPGINPFPAETPCFVPEYQQCSKLQTACLLYAVHHITITEVIIYWEKY